jgi:hypothetical protein
LEELMSDYVPVKIRRPIFEKLQRLAVLTGDESSAIERLIAHWEAGFPTSEPPREKAVPAATLWHSPTGDVLPVGATLQATDGGRVHQATVEHDGIRYNGDVYDSPSAAARAVKEARGLKGPSASTNGREFWKLRDPKTNRWIPINALRPAHRIDGDALLDELIRAK